ncbi:MAG TPA: hypothetical protein VJV74_15365, partial [Terriglobia bacterium]|nr:hypothetical protein [Terriglobia bacterium]
MLNFGCRASYADGVALRGQLLEAGLEEAERGKPSDLAVLNTCTVTSTADAEVRQVIRRIHRSNPRCQILVTGCYAQRAPGEIAELSGVTWVVGNSHKHVVAELVKTQFGRELASHTPADPETPAEKAALETTPRAEFIQISQVPVTQPPQVIVG